MDPAQQRDRDAHELSRLGYAQQLLRDMGGFSSFALSFSIISVLTGAVTLYGHGLKFGGPLVMSVGWPLVAVMTLFVAGSLAQLSSAYPTAGALYHWSAMLGGPGFGFFTAWLNTIGQFAITAGIDYGLAEFIADLCGWPGRGRVLSIFAALLLSHAALNHVGVRVVARLNHVSAWYHMAVGALVVAALVLFAPKQDAAFLLTRFTSEAAVLDGHPLLAALWGGPLAYGFCVGLLQAGWTFTGYDASAHVTEETLDPARNAPWGIFLSVAVSGLVGWALLLAVTISIGDLRAAAAAPNPFIHVLTTALGGRLGSALVWLVLGAMWFCGLSSITSNSRMLFAFARDGGLPFSHLVARVSPRFLTPHWAVWISAGAAFAVALWSEAYSAMTALSTIALYASYGLPIAVGLWARASGRWQRRGPWDLGRYSLTVNLISLIWIAGITVLLVLPPNELAGKTFLGCLAALAVYWAGYMRHRFAGPRVTVETGDSSPQVAQ
jgi:amino acid transporter